MQRAMSGIPHTKNAFGAWTRTVYRNADRRLRLRPCVSEPGRSERFCAGSIRPRWFGERRQRLRLARHRSIVPRKCRRDAGARAGQAPARPLPWLCAEPCSPGSALQRVAGSCDAERAKERTKTIRRQVLYPAELRSLEIGLCQKSESFSPNNSTSQEPRPKDKLTNGNGL
jgi:hypothetical protein